MEQELMKLGFYGVVVLGLAKAYTKEKELSEKKDEEQKKYQRELIDSLKEDSARREDELRIENQRLGEKYQKIINNIQDTFTTTLFDIRNDSKELHDDYKKFISNFNDTLVSLAKAIEGTNSKIDNFSDRVSHIEKSTETLSEKVNLLIENKNS